MDTAGTVQVRGEREGGYAALTFKKGTQDFLKLHLKI